MTLHILIPAAGASSRMRGRDKLIEDVAQEPLLHRQAKLALSVAERVTVALPAPTHPFHEARSAALEGLPLQTATYPASDIGLGGTVASCAASLPQETSHLMVLLPDLVELTKADLATLITDLDDHPRRAASFDGTPGHPVIFPAHLFADLAKCPPDDKGPRIVLAGHKPRLVHLPNDHAILDLDTPEAWANWRAKQG